MNPIKIVVAGIAAGVVTWLTSFVMHGVILGPTYLRFEVFTQEQTSPLTFLFVGVCVALMTALLYARTHSCWGGGLKGGMVFGVFLGLAAFFGYFYNPLVLEGFPYFLAWCWGGVNLINAVIGGAVLGLIYKP